MNRIGSENGFLEGECRKPCKKVEPIRLIVFLQTSCYVVLVGTCNVVSDFVTVARRPQ